MSRRIVVDAGADLNVDMAVIDNGVVDRGQDPDRCIEATAADDVADVAADMPTKRNSKDPYDCGFDPRTGTAGEVDNAMVHYE